VKIPDSLGTPAAVRKAVDQRGRLLVASRAWLFLFIGKRESADCHILVVGDRSVLIGGSVKQSSSLFNWSTTMTGTSGNTSSRDNLCTLSMKVYSLATRHSRRQGLSRPRWKSNPKRKVDRVGSIDRDSIFKTSFLFCMQARV